MTILIAILSRLAKAAPTLLAIAVLNFCLLHAAPGDPAVVLRDLMDICHEISRAKTLGDDADFDALQQLARLGNGHAYLSDTETIEQLYQLLSAFLN